MPYREVKTSTIAWDTSKTGGGNKTFDVKLLRYHFPQGKCLLAFKFLLRYENELL